VNKQQTLQMHQLEREKALFRYSNALDRGDFDTIAGILHQAEQDAVLERMILEMNELYQSEYKVAVREDDAALVRQLIRQHLPLNPDADEEVEVPQLTVRDVMNRLRTDLAQRHRGEPEVTLVDQQIQQSNTPLPEDLKLKKVAQLFEQLGLTVSRRFQKLFRDTAILLSMGREHGALRLAETRRQYRETPKSNSVQTQHEEES
jgi:hypothetical protein